MLKMQPYVTETTKLQCCHAHLRKEAIHNFFSISALITKLFEEKFSTQRAKTRTRSTTKRWLNRTPKDSNPFRKYCTKDGAI